MYRQERGEIRRYECSLVYESKVERKTDSKLTGHSMKLLKINRLEEINTRYNSNRLEKTAFFQSMEKVERTTHFQEEKFRESDPGIEDEKVTNYIINFVFPKHASFLLPVSLRVYYVYFRVELNFSFQSVNMCCHYKSLVASFSLLDS